MKKYLTTLLLVGLLTSLPCIAKPHKINTPQRIPPVVKINETTLAKFDAFKDKLYEISSRTATGINIVQYREQLGDLQVASDSLERQPDYLKLPDYPKFKEVQSMYIFAGEVWQCQLDVNYYGHSNLGFAKPEDCGGPALMKDYGVIPKILKSNGPPPDYKIVEGNPKYHDGVVEKETALSAIWDKASNLLKKH